VRRVVNGKASASQGEHPGPRPAGGVSPQVESLLHRALVQVAVMPATGIRRRERMKNPMLRVRTPGITKSRTIIRLGRSIAAHFRLPVALKAITSVVATVSVLGLPMASVSASAAHVGANTHAGTLEHDPSCPSADRQLLSGAQGAEVNRWEAHDLGESRARACLRLFVDPRLELDASYRPVRFCHASLADPARQRVNGRSHLHFPPLGHRPRRTGERTCGKGERTTRHSKSDELRSGPEDCLLGRREGHHFGQS
jgi:hypothetical protein